MDRAWQRFAASVSYVHRIFWWKKRLREAEARKFVEVKVSSTMTPSDVGAGIEIRLTNDHRLLVPPGFDANHLQALLAVLEPRP